MITNYGQTVKARTKLKLDINMMDCLKMEKLLKESQYTLGVQNILANLKISSPTDMEPSFGKMAINIMENGKMAKIMVMELKYGKMEENM